MKQRTAQSTYIPKRNPGYISVDAILNKHVLNNVIKIHKSIKNQK